MSDDGKNVSKNVSSPITSAFVAEVINSFAPPHRPGCVETKVRVVRGHLRRGPARVVDSRGFLHIVTIVGVAAGVATELSDTSQPTVIVLVKGATLADMVPGRLITQE